MGYCALQPCCQGGNEIPSVGLSEDLPGVLEGLYRKYNRREFVHPDPLEFLYSYENPGDREVVGFVASSLAFGRVEQILRSVAAVLRSMAPSPRAFLLGSSRESLGREFAGFRHRFASDRDLISMLWGLREVLRRYGSLQACFTAHLDGEDATIVPALCAFVGEIRKETTSGNNVLLAQPHRASACKKLNLFLRWMVRQDPVDPGGWNEVDPGKLIVPLDVHLHRVGVALGMTRRKQADLRTALEITAAFRNMRADDPVRYDFVLTRPGIWRNQAVFTALGNPRSGDRA